MTNKTITKSKKDDTKNNMKTAIKQQNHKKHKKNRITKRSYHKIRTKMLNENHKNSKSQKDENEMQLQLKENHKLKRMKNKNLKSYHKKD